MPQILVVPLSAVPATVASHRPSHLISLLDPGHPIPTPDGIDAARHLRLGIHDISDVRDDHVTPGREHVERIVAFVDEWEASRPLLIHCWAGISRSTATAFIALCRLNPAADERAMARALRRAAPHAQPNRLLVAHADHVLDRGGRMSAAVESIGTGEIVFEGRLFGLPARFNETV